MKKNINKNNQVSNPYLNNDRTIDMHQLSEYQFQTYFEQAADVIIFSKSYVNQAASNNGQPQEPIEIIFISSEVFIDNKLFKESTLPSINQVFLETGFQSIEQIEMSPHISWFTISTLERPITLRKLSNFLFEGNMLCAIPKLKVLMATNVADIPVRTPEESALEVTIRGPKDGLVENLSTNVALIRRRIRNQHLMVESYSIGNLTDTKLVLLYMENIISNKIIDIVKERIEGIDTEQLVTMGQLEELIADKTYLIPTVDYTGRPDFVVDNLLNGRFVILLDNNPTAMLAPGNVFQLLTTPEDNYYPLLSNNISKLFRLTSLIATIFIPSFYIAITTFHPDQLPFTMLATISSARMGIPMEAAIEMFLIMVFMEIFREASVRMPGGMSQTITVVGGLIIGEAAIRAGLVSPIIVVVAAITIISGATLVNQSLVNSVVLYRFFAFIISSILGIFGFIFAYILFLLFLSRIQSFGVPFLAPLSPLSLKNLIISMFQVPLKYRIGRPSYLHTKKEKDE